MISAQSVGVEIVIGREPEIGADICNGGVRVAQRFVNVREEQVGINFGGIQP